MITRITIVNFVNICAAFRYEKDSQKVQLTIIYKENVDDIVLVAG